MCIYLQAIYIFTFFIKKLASLKIHFHIYQLMTVFIYFTVKVLIFTIKLVDKYIAGEGLERYEKLN